MERSCRSFARVAICPARTSEPRGGICVCWSQPRSSQMVARSEISASRSRSSPNAGGWVLSPVTFS